MREITYQRKFKTFIELNREKRHINDKNYITSESVELQRSHEQKKVHWTRYSNKTYIEKKSRYHNFQDLKYSKKTSENEIVTEKPQPGQPEQIQRKFLKNN